MPLKMAGKAKTYNTEQKRLRYAVNRLEKKALKIVLPHCDETTREVRLETLKILIDMLDLAFRDQDRAATARRKLAGLKQ